MFKEKFLPRFLKEVKLSKKCGKDTNKLIKVIECLKDNVPLDKKCMPHKLSGKYSEYWECHIEPDWLLIYKQEEGVLTLLRLGTYSDLFK